MSYSYRFSLTLVSILVLVLTDGCKWGVRRQGSPYNKVEADSIYTKATAMEAMQHNPDRALVIIDSAVLVGNVARWYGDYLRMKVYTQSYEGMQLDSTFAIGGRLMQNDSVVRNSSNRLEVLDLLVTASRLSSNDELLLQYTEQKEALCRELGQEIEAMRTNVERGAVLARIGRLDEGLALIDDVIDRLAGVRRFNEMDTWIIAMRRKINILQEHLSSSPQISTLSLRILTRLDDYSRNPAVYQDDSFREPGEEERPRYIEFYRAKCYVYLADFYAETNPREARRYLALLSRTEWGRSYDGRLMTAPILCQLGDYAKMEAIYQEMDAMPRKSSDSLNTEYLTMLQNRAVAAEAQGRTDDALALWKRYDALNGLKAERTISGKTYMYVARYQSDQQQRTLEQVQELKALYHSWAWLLGFLVFVSLVYIGYFHIIRRKERFARKEVAAPPAPAKRPSAMDDEELFQYLDQIVRRERLYLNPLMDRQTLIKRLGVSAHRIGAAFSKGSKFQSLPGYIRSLRLEHACGMLLSRPDLSVKAIGEASGFSNNSTFCSDFKAAYGVTPSGYRHEKSGKNN